LILLDALGVTSIARGRLRVAVSLPTVSPAPPSRVPVSPSARVATAVTIDRARDDDVDDVSDDIVTVLDVARAIARAVSTTARRIMIDDFDDRRRVPGRTGRVRPSVHSDF
tara:strand:- start:146 stop:478 length:333 start_codon:yes stop_codon:yes gene_type:complete